jgi:hypothetical protein
MMGELFEEKCVVVVFRETIIPSLPLKTGNVAREARTLNKKSDPPGTRYYPLNGEARTLNKKSDPPGTRYYPLNGEARTLNKKSDPPGTRYYPLNGEARTLNKKSDPPGTRTQNLLIKRI